MSIVNELQNLENILQSVNNVISLKDIEFRYLKPTAYKLNDVGLYTYHWMILSNYKLTTEGAKGFWGKTRQELVNSIPVVTADTFSLNTNNSQKSIVLFYKDFSKSFQNTYVKTNLQGHSTPHTQYFGGSGSTFNVSCILSAPLTLSVGAIHNSAKVQIISDLVESGDSLFMYSPMFNVDYNVFEIAIESLNIKPYSQSSLIEIDLSFFDIGSEEYFSGYGENSTFYKNTAAQ